MRYRRDVTCLIRRNSGLLVTRQEESGDHLQDAASADVCVPTSVPVWPVELFLQSEPKCRLTDLMSVARVTDEDFINTV